MSRYIISGCTCFLLAAGSFQLHDRPEWEMPEPYREVQRVTLESRRSLLLRMVDSMPAEQLRKSAAPGQRDFAQQIHHTAALDALALARLIGSQPPAFPDTTVALNTKTGLREIIETGFGWLDSTLSSQTAHERNAIVAFAGRDIPRWQLFDEINEHSMWTCGQLVANFRSLGLAPPQFRFF